MSDVVCVDSCQFTTAETCGDYTCQRHRATSFAKNKKSPPSIAVHAHGNQILLLLLIFIRTQSACNMFHVIVSEQGNNQKNIK